MNGGYAVGKTLPSKYNFNTTPNNNFSIVFLFIL